MDTVRRMNTQLLHRDPCPLYRPPLTLRTTVEVRSNTAHPAHTGTVPHREGCAGDMAHAQSGRTRCTPATASDPDRANAAGGRGAARGAGTAAPAVGAGARWVTSSGS
ncbi:hypothetical protein GCM10010247_67650 [Streptomyces calvus]|nr:hypothetical protein GCM10010247_67650 [Streptomyces calvus]